MTSRRRFLALLAACPASAATDLRTEVAIVGAGVGGCAAALAALRNGARVLLTEETDWIGGQLTSQAVPPDEHQWIEAFGATQLYRQFRSGVRAYYLDHFPLTAELRSQPHFNPGGGLVSRLTHEPRVALAVLEAMLAPYLSGGQLQLLLRHKPEAAGVIGDRVRAVTLRSLETAATKTVEAEYFLDATETGDLLPLTRCEYVTGFESRKQTGEPHAPAEAQPANMQAFTICFAIDHRADENHIIDKPAEYKFWRDYIPQLQPPWPGKLLSWSMTNPITLEPRAAGFDPERPRLPDGSLNLWQYRRIAAQSHLTPGSSGSDITLVNWPQNDYWLGNLFEVPPAEAVKHLRRAKQLSLSLLYWMQTEAPRPDGKAGWPGLRLRHDQTGTEDGLAKYPYIRESRRILAEFTVTEQHVSTEARAGKPAELFFDSVGVGSYRIDLHPSSGGDNYLDISSLPFQIPLGALLPRRLENLLPACKNLGVTHITNGCYRLHPVEWNIGEAAGALAAFCLRRKALPRQVRASKAVLAEFQKNLTTQGVELEWPRITPR